MFLLDVVSVVARTLFAAEHVSRMVVRKGLEAFLGMELAPGVEGRHTVRRYALLTAASTPDTTLEAGERTASWGAPPYPGGLVPLDVRSGLVAIGASELAHGQSKKPVELPTLHFRTRTDVDTQVSMPPTADDQTRFEIAARAYVQNVEEMVERLTRAALATTSQPHASLEARSSSLMPTLLDTSPPMAATMATSQDANVDGTPSLPQGKLTVWEPPAALFDRRLAEPHDLVGPLMTSYQDVMWRTRLPELAKLTYAERGKAVATVKDLRHRMKDLCSHGHMQIHTMLGFSPWAKLQTAAALADFCEALKGKVEIHGKAVSSLQTDLKGRLPIPGAEYSSQGQWWANWISAKNFRTSGSDAQVAGGLPVLVVQLRPDLHSKGFPTPGLRGSESVFIAFFLDYTPQVLALVGPRGGYEVDDHRPMAMPIMSCVSGAAGLSHSQRRWFLRQGMGGCSAHMVMTAQGDTSEFLHDIIRTALEDTFIHCDFD